MGSRITFCITCKNRTQHLEQTLPQNLENNNGSTRFVLLNYNSRDHLESYVFQNHRKAIESGKLVVYRFTEPGPFRMAHAKNLAHRLGLLEGGDILVNLDADNYTGTGFDDYIAEQFNGGGTQKFLWARMIKDGTMTRGISGRIVVPRQAFRLSGGYDEKFSTWSPDDKDFNIRLRRLGYDGCEIDPRFLNAVLHNDRMRFHEYPEAKFTMNAEPFTLRDRENVSIANYGQVGCGVVYRNDERHPIEIRPLPTRIFGIGMHKTATTSLHHALQVLGYDSAHWENAHWAKAIWEEMKSQGRSITLEKHYALSDLPIPVLYRELDAAYPGSKFILTIREEAEWLESVRNHWSSKNPFRSAWDTDPFSHRIHREIYGQRWFDPDVFLERYRRHNAEVVEHFRNRPQDLLVMDMSTGAGWYELCGFLRESVPDMQYPRLLKTPKE